MLAATPLMKSSAVLQQLLDAAYWSVLSDLMFGGSWSWCYSAVDGLATSSTRPAVASMGLGGSGTQQATADAIDAAVDGQHWHHGWGAGGNSDREARWFSPAFVPSATPVDSTTGTDARSSFNK